MQQASPTTATAAVEAKATPPPPPAVAGGGLGALFHGQRVLPYMLLFPQLAVTAIFFLWPAYQALEQSLFIEDAFGFSRQFVWLDNFRQLIMDAGYRKSFITSIVFGGSVTVLSLGLALILAAAANRLIRSALAYQTCLIWPYAVAPAIAGVIWYFLFNPSLGIIAYWLSNMGVDWNHYSNANQALWLVIFAAAWKQISYNFLFCIAGMQAIPNSIMEAARMDGAKPIRRFFTITLPLLSPTLFFLLIINMVYAFFDTFALIHATTSGGPGDATTILVFRVYATGFVGQDYGASAAQSVILMAMVILLVALQFRYVERRVVY